MSIICRPLCPFNSLTVGWFLSLDPDSKIPKPLPISDILFQLCYGDLYQQNTPNTFQSYYKVVIHRQNKSKKRDRWQMSPVKVAFDCWDIRLMKTVFENVFSCNYIQLPTPFLLQVTWKVKFFLILKKMYLLHIDWYIRIILKFTT